MVTDWCSKPWNSDVDKIPSEIFQPKGMLGDEERRMLYFTAAHNFSGKGRIVDAGSFLGASTFALASGVASLGRNYTRSPIAAFDYFKANDDYVRDYIAKNFRPIDPNGDYFDLFEAQVATYRALIETYPGDLLSHKWTREPIEILFVDVAKTAALNAHVFLEFFPKLIPGHSIIVQQDYFHCWHPYMQICMEYLANYLELLDPRVIHQSRVWRLNRQVPSEELARCKPRAIGLAEGCYLLDRLLEKSRPQDKAMIMVIKLTYLFYEGQLDQIRKIIPQTEEECDRNPAPHEIWKIQLEKLKLLINSRQRNSVPLNV
jgi:hypothetical protein